MDEGTISREVAAGALKAKADDVTEEDVTRVLGRKEEAERKYRDIPGRFSRTVAQVKLLFELLRGYVDGSYREVPWATIAVAVAALVYFLSPVDVIPDLLPVIGYADDASVLALAVSLLQEDLKAFCRWKGYDPEIYFG